MNTLKLIILALLITGCSALLSKKPSHVGAEIIEIDLSVGRYENIQKYASYFVASLSEYPEILANENFKKNISKSRPMRNLIEACSGEKRDYRSPYYVLYSNDHEIRLAYPYLSSCKLNIENIKSYISSINVNRENIKKKSSEKKAEKAKYRKSEKFASKVIEQVGIDRAIAKTCYIKKLSTRGAYFRYELDAINYTKKITGKYYDTGKMKTALNRGYYLIKQRMVKATYDYCRAIDANGAMYQRFK